MDSGNMISNSMNSFPVCSPRTIPNPGISRLFPGFTTLWKWFVIRNIFPFRWGISNKKPHNASFNDIVFFQVNNFPFPEQRYILPFQYHAELRLQPFLFHSDFPVLLLLRTLQMPFANQYVPV